MASAAMRWPLPPSSQAVVLPRDLQQNGKERASSRKPQAGSSTADNHLQRIAQHGHAHRQSLLIPTNETFHTINANARLCEADFYQVASIFF